MFALPNLCSIIGKFGSGKSLYMLEIGLEVANRYRKPLVCNFELNYAAVRRYCELNKLSWFASCGRIIYVDVAKSGAFAMLRPGSVVLFDEVGVFINARNWKTLTTDFAERLPRLRHFDIHLVCAFQFFDQVDKNIREQCQHWIVCESVTRYDNKLQMPRMLARYAYHYETEKFEMYCFDVKLRTSTIRKWFAAMKVRWSFLFVGDMIYALINIYKLLKWYYAYMQCRDAKSQVLYSRRHPFKETATIEQQLFKCYASNGFGNKAGLPIKSSKVINVTFEGDTLPIIPAKKNGKVSHAIDKSFADLMIKK
jgi:hypothetical protein